MRYGLYARKSTEEDERQAQSIEDQKGHSLEAAAAKGISDVVIFEESRSAKEEGRPEFNRMIAMVDRGELDGIIAWHPDRLSRNEMDAAAITMRVRKGYMKDLLFAKYFFHNSPEGIMMLQIALSQSQYFSSKLSGDVKRGMESKIQKGWFPHRASAGYINNKYMEKGEKTISPDPERFPIIRRAFDYILSNGYTPITVLKLLNAEWGYRSPVRKRMGDQPMSRTHFYRLLINPFYAGFFVVKGQLYQGKHHPMITLEEHRRIKEIFGVGERLQPKRHAFAYTGMIYCKHCRHLITAQFTTNRHGTEYTYYRCTRCRGQNISEKDLQEQIKAEVDRVSVPVEQFKTWAQEAVARFYREGRATDHVIYDQKLSTLASIDQQLDALLTVLTKGLIDEEEYKGRKTRLQNDRLILRKETEEAELKADRAREAMENEIAFLTNVRAWIEFGDLEVKRACARALGYNFLLDGKKVLWEPHPLLERVREEYKGLEVEYLAIKHNEMVSESTKNELLEPIRSAWSGLWDFNQTLAIREGLHFPNIAVIVPPSRVA